jgi:hypothetical protein
MGRMKDRKMGEYEYDIKGRREKVLLKAFFPPPFRPSSLSYLLG